jgi:putative ABC transport system permease protein
MPGRLFRALLMLLPAEFRADYGREMEATFRAEAAAETRTGRMRLWAETIVDQARTAPAEHLDILIRDLRFAARTMLRHPVHTATALVTLMLGIGAAVAMFSVINAVLLSPLPYRDAGGLVIVQEQRESDEPGSLGYLTFADLRERARSMSVMAAVTQSFANLAGDGQEPERVGAMRVSASYFPMIGVSPALGRGFSEAEDRPGEARRVAILSDALWRRRFAADPSIIGRPIAAGITTYVVVGVMPPGFRDLVAGRLYEGAEMWFPLGYDPAAPYACRTCRHVRVFGRLARGETAETAARELSDHVAVLADAHPSEYDHPSIAVRRLSDFFLGPVRPVLLVLSFGVALLLLVACGNVANLQLLRTSERGQEVAVRAALGVTRIRLGRQLLTEALLLALMGGALGLAAAAACVRVVRAIGPAQLPRLENVAIDPPTAAMALACAIGCGVVFALVPLKHLRRRDAAAVLTGAGRRTDTADTWRLRALLVGGNVAMAAVLLVGAGLLVRSTIGLLAVEPGFRYDHILTMRVVLGGARYGSGPPEEQIRAVSTFYARALERARALPGVEAASAINMLPLGGGRDLYGLHIAGRPRANPEDAPNALRFVAHDGIFDALRIPILTGRVFDRRDAQGAPLVAVINRAAAQDLFPGEDPIGHQVMLGIPSAPARTIVGVVGDVRHEGLDEPPGYQVYVPHAQWAWAEPMMSLVVRTSGDPLQSAGAVRGLLRDLDAMQPVTSVQRYDSVVGVSTATRRFAASLLGGFAISALTLAVVGLYGALGVVVRQRQREIGIRLALGAAAGEIRRMVLKQGMRPAAGGLLLGLATALAAAGVLKTLLYGIEPRDPLTFAASTLVICVAALLACLLPAARAARVDPAAAIRE